MPNMRSFDPQGAALSSALWVPGGQCWRPSEYPFSPSPAPDCNLNADADTCDSLTAFNCQPVRFEAELKDSLQKGFPEGLNSSRDFHFVFVDVDMLDQASIDEIKRLQPKAKFVYMCNSLDLAKAMKRFNLTVCLARHFQLK